MNNNKIPVFRWLLMFWLCNVASVVLSQLGGSAAPNSSNGSALTVTGILGVVCVIAEFIPFYQLSRVSDRLRRAFTLNIIGGASFMGGKGTMVGTMLGALIIAVLRNGFSLLSVSSAVQNSTRPRLSSAPYCSTLLVSAWLLRLAVWLLSNF